MTVFAQTSLHELHGYSISCHCLFRAASAHHVFLPSLASTRSFKYTSCAPPSKDAILSSKITPTDIAPGCTRRRRREQPVTLSAAPLLQTRTIGSAPIGMMIRRVNVEKVTRILSRHKTRKSRTCGSWGHFVPQSLVVQRQTLGKFDKESPP